MWSHSATGKKNTIVKLGSLHEFMYVSISGLESKVDGFFRHKTYSLGRSLCSGVKLDFTNWKLPSSQEDSADRVGSVSLGC